ncbi:CHAT domain-containing protein [Psychromonas ossibalaenae]|uniref:CHAT domain-containing protein n=1 Tax=Psychromonas ossibalaenae TaxID=444922 RepID=UPI0009FBCB43|nr:CHAT domain-containing protein [Psychromonas ossibalaenae]
MMKKRLLLISVTFALSACSLTPTLEVSEKAYLGKHREAVDQFTQEIGEFQYWAEYRTKYSHNYWGDLSLLCNSYLMLQNFSQAKECLSHWKIEMLKQVGDAKEGEEVKKWVLADYNRLNSTIYLELGNYPEAYRTYKLAREYSASPKVDNCAVPLRIGIEGFSRMDANGAVAAVQLGYRDQAIAIAEGIDCLKPSSIFLNESAKDIKVKNASKARIYLALGDYNKAKQAMLFSQGLYDTFARSMDAVTTLGLSELIGAGEERANPFNFDETYMLAKIAQGSGQLEEAEKVYLSLLYTAEQSDTPIVQVYNNLIFDPKKETNHSPALLNRQGIYYQLLYDLGVIAEQLGRPGEALDFYQQSVEVIEQQRATINTEASKIGFIGNKEAVYQDLVSLLIKQGKLEQAFIYAERSKARALIDTLASKQDFSPKNVDERPPMLLAQLNKIDSDLKTADYSEASGRSRSADRGLLRKTQQQLQTTQPELASLVTVSAPEVTELQQRLAGDETLIEFYGSGTQLFAFLLSRSGIKAATLNGEDLAAAVSVLRDDLQKNDSNAYQHNANLLYQRLFKPLKGDLHTEKLIIVPHGPLHYLPFTALYNGSDFLIDQYDISILPSASVMAFINKEVTAPHPLLILGNPELGDPKLALPGAEQEAKTIASQQRGASLLLGSDATETQVKQNGVLFKTLHFASHGIFDPEQPLSSGLLLAKDQSNDGMLTVRELYELNLNADLITLSACETGLGKISNGDDVVGFTRGFLYAGTNSIISSLWKVDDQATSQLMQHFYAKLANSSDKRLALKQAQLAVKTDYNRHPYYWAAFQLTGR